MPRRPDRLFGSAGECSDKASWPPLRHRALPTDGTRRPQAVEHMLNDPVGFGHHELAAGRCWRGTTGRGGRPSLIGLLPPCPAQPGCCLSTDDLDCGREPRTFDARCALWVCSPCRRAVCES